ncbi:hypothetical protein BH10BDE1_BH10BDE1_14300 [soil metagenome]
MSQENSSNARMTAWYVSRSGDASGPFATDMVLSMLREGNLQPLDLVFREGETEWKPAASFRELKNSTRPDSSFENRHESPPDVPFSDGSAAVPHGSNLNAMDPNKTGSRDGRSLSWIVLRPHSSTYLQEGPFETQTIIDGLQEGRFQFAQYAWHVGMNQWMRIGDLREFDRRSRSRDSKPHVPPPLPDPIAAVLLEDDKDLDAEEFHVMMRGQLKHDMTPNPLDSMQAMNVTQLGSVGMGGAAADSPEERTAQANANKAVALVSTANLAGVPWEQDASDGYAQSVELPAEQSVHLAELSVHLIDDENSGINLDHRNAPVFVTVDAESGISQLDKTPLPFIPPAPVPVVPDIWNKWGRYAAGAALGLVALTFASHLISSAPSLSTQRSPRAASVTVEPTNVAEPVNVRSATVSAAAVAAVDANASPMAAGGTAPVSVVPTSSIATAPATPALPSVPADFGVVGLKLDRPDGQIVIQGSLPQGVPVAVTFKGRLGQILSKMSVRKTVSVQRKGGEIPTLRLKDLKLPAGSYTVEVDAGGAKAKNEIFVGTRDKKFLDRLEMHLREVSLETQSQKKALFYAAKELDILARELGQNYGQLRGKPEQWSAFFGKWNKKVETVQRSLTELGKKKTEEQAFPEETAALFQAFSGLNDVASQYEQGIGQRRDVASDALTELIAELTRQKDAIGETTSRPTADTPDGVL